MSCASAGNCSAGGYYMTAPAHRQAFVVSEVNGTWGTAIEVPGTAALNQGGAPRSTRCRAPRRATAAQAGTTPTAPATSRRSWSARSTAPGAPRSRCPAPRPSTRAGTPRSARCRAPSAGNCSAGGYYIDSSGHNQAFVVSETNGTWGTAMEVPGTAALNQGGNAAINSVSCASAGNCSAGGYYHDSSGHSQAFVVSETNGTWGTAKEVPGTAALNQAGTPRSTRCRAPSAGNCSAGGYYTDSSLHTQAFVVSEINGTWRHRHRGPRHRGPQPGRDRRDHLGVVRLGGQLRRGRVLRRQLRPLPGVRGQQELIIT